MNRKTNRIILLTALLLALSLFAGGCEKPSEQTGSETPTETGAETTEAVIPALTWESHTTKPQELRRKYQYATYNGVTYEVEENLYEDEVKNAHVAELDRFLNKASEVLSIAIPEGMHIYMESSLDPYAVSGLVHTNPADFGTTHFFTQLLLGLTGEDVSYGEAFAIADDTARKAELSIYKDSCAADGEVKAFLTNEDKLFFMDFTMPLFETKYFSEGEAGMTASIATAFYRQLVEKEGIEKTVSRLQKTEEADKEILAAKQEWLKAVGVTFTYEPLFAQIFHHTLTERDKYPYVFEAYLTNWHFQVADVQRETFPVMVRGYQDLYRSMGKDMDSAIEWFKAYLDGEVAPVDVFTEFYTDDKLAENAGAVYINAYKRIVLYHDWMESKYSLLHEYCHYLTIGCNMNDLSIVLYEGMAEYLSEIACHNNMAREFYMDYYGDSLKTLTYLDLSSGEFPLDVYHIVQAYYYYAGYHDGQSYMQITGMINPGRKTSDTILPSELSYSDATGFVTWLFAHYDKDDILTHSATFDDLSAFTGKDFRTMFREYGAWIEEKAREVAPLAFE